MIVPPLVSLVAAFVLLLAAIVFFKIHPFLALTVVSLLLGVAVGMPPDGAVSAFLGGFGATMEWIGVVIVLGTLLGELLGSAGGTARISSAILGAVGSKRLPLAMGLTGYVVSIPAFVDVAYIMLRPITESLAARTRRNILVVGLSLTAGLTASHALVPPTPGPLTAAGILHADLGRMILLSGFVAACAAAGGLLWATLYCRRVEIPYDKQIRKELDEAASAPEGKEDARPSTAASFLPILLPLALIAAGSFLGDRSGASVAAALHVPDVSLVEWLASAGVATLHFLGIPVVALLLGVVAAACLLRRGRRLPELNRLLERSIERSAVVIMITGAGGGFGGVIKAAGLGDHIVAALDAVSLPGLLFPFLLAAALTTATGSLTVSMTTSASVLASVHESLGLSAELTAAAIGAGSLGVIHANSSFFWLLSRLHDVRPDILYRTYSAQSVCMALGGLGGVLILWLVGVH